jgi:hypothetical protein
LICILVDQGSFAHVNAAPFSSAAAFCGETHQTATKWSGVEGIRTEASLLAALKDFFKDNPTWE